MHFLKFSFISRLKKCCLLLILLYNTLTFNNLSIAEDEQMKALVSSWLEQMSAVINSRNLNTIEKFFLFYTGSSAQFIKHSSLYIAGSDTPIAQDNILLNRDKYIPYIYSLTIYPKIYGYKANLTDLTKQSDGTYIASVAIEEVALTETDNDNVKNSSHKDTNTTDEEKSDNQPSCVKTIVSTNCNMSFLQSATLVLLGSNCVEKIAIQ